MEDQIVPPDSTELATDPPMRPKPKPEPLPARRGRRPGQPPAAHHVAVPAETLAPIHEVAAMTGQQPAELLAGFRDFLAQALVSLAAQYAAQRLADFEARLAVKKAEMQAAAAGGVA